MKHYGKFYIDGQWIDALGSSTFEVTNPATEAVIATIAMGNGEDVERAVRAARGAFASFSTTTRQIAWICCNTSSMPSSGARPTSPMPSLPNWVRLSAPRCTSMDRSRAFVRA